MGIETWGIILSKQRKTKALIRLRGWAGSVVPLLFTYGKNRFSHDLALMILHHILAIVNAFEPRHDKTNKVSVRPAKTQISLGIRPVLLVFAVRLMGS